MTAPKAIAVRIGAVLWSIWLAGCGISQPQTAAEFRNGVANGIASGATKETFEVDRPLAQVGASFQRLASEGVWGRWILGAHRWKQKLQSREMGLNAN